MICSQVLSQATANLVLLQHSLYPRCPPNLHRKRGSKRRTMNNSPNISQILANIPLSRQFVDHKKRRLSWWLVLVRGTNKLPPRNNSERPCVSSPNSHGKPLIVTRKQPLCFRFSPLPSKRCLFLSPSYGERSVNTLFGSNTTDYTKYPIIEGCYPTNLYEPSVWPKTVSVQWVLTKMSYCQPTESGDAALTFDFTPRAYGRNILNCTYSWKNSIIPD